MAADPKKRQKQLERRAAKRKVKHHHLVREKSAGLPERLTAAAGYPVLDSWAILDLWEQGLGWVGLSRQLPNGSVAFAIFLVDRYCLGVKNAYADITSRYDYDSRILRKMRFGSPSRDLAPAAVRKLVEGAVEYARGLGLPPHPDYQRARLIFGTIDPAECTEEFEFGKDGKPLFIAGPNDTEERCRHIIKTLERSCGPGGSHYLIPIAGSSEIIPESLREQGAHLIDEEETSESIDQQLDFKEEEMS